MRDAEQRAGAHAFADLLGSIGEEAARNFDAFYRLCPGFDPSHDVRDYARMVELVSASITANVVHGNPGQRQGFLRALVWLLAEEADCPSRGADPMAGTALAFDAEAVPSADPQRRAAALQAHAQQGQRNTMETT